MNRELECTAVNLRDGRPDRDKPQPHTFMSAT